MERYLRISKVNFKFNLFPHVIAAIILCLISPFIMGVKNLDSINTAKVLDVYISLLGIILLVPLFFPEQDRDINDLIRSKKESISVIHIIRLIEALLCLFIIVTSFLFYLKIGNCTFPFKEYLYGTIADCIFLGGLGIFIYSIINSLCTSYMVPVLYYIMCFGSGKKYFGKFYLFSMMGGSIGDKKFLLVSGIIMIAAGIILKSRRRGIWR